MATPSEEMNKNITLSIGGHKPWNFSRIPTLGIESINPIYRRIIDRVEEYIVVAGIEMMF